MTSPGTGGRALPTSAHKRLMYGTEVSPLIARDEEELEEENPDEDEDADVGDVDDFDDDEE